MSLDSFRTRQTISSGGESVALYSLTTLEREFPQVAKLTRGAYCKFDRSSPDQLKRLLGAVAAYAAGGRQALLKYGREQGGAAALLTNQMK